MDKRILIISDDLGQGRVLAMKLEEMGFSVNGRVFSSLRDEITAPLETPDLVLLDLPFTGDEDDSNGGGRPQALVVCFPQKEARTLGSLAWLARPFSAGELKAALDSAWAGINREVRTKARLERFRLSFDHSSIGMALASPEGFFIQVNRSFIEMFGLPREELLHKNFFDLVFGEELKKGRRNFRDLLAGEKKITWLETKLLKKDGDPAWGLLSSSLVRDAAGRPLHFSLQLQDITERKEAEEDLRRSEERFRTIADFTHDWEYWIGPDGRFLWVSPSCLRITGFRPFEFESDPGLLSGITFPDDLKLVEEHAVWEKTNFEPGAMYFRIYTRTGELRWIDHHCQPVFGADGEVLGRRAGNRDVTERKEFEERLGEYHRQLRTLASELTLAEERERRRIAVDLHDRVGHSLALCQIKLNQIQAQTKLPALDEVVDLIEEAVLETRALTMDLSPPSLYELGLEAALDEYAQELADEYGLEVDVRDDRAPKPLEDDARVALYRSAKELMINVVKHARAAKMTVDISRKDRDIVIVVRDDGQGFSASQPRKIKSFGLFSIREWLKRLGGKIMVESTPGEGSLLTLTAPLKED
ncbi:MAG: PAS domain S-box protein [Pseudomonadota bacterium]